MNFGQKALFKLRQSISKLLIVPSTKINGLRCISRFSGFIWVCCRGVFTSVKFRPRLADEVALEARFFNSDGLTAVIIQGPVGANIEFLLETVKLYKKFFANQEVVTILVLWESDRKRLEDVIDEYVDYCLFLNPPEQPGIFNVDLQTYALTRGISLARKIGASYVLRTRTDCRIYDPDCISFLKSVLETFPIGSPLGSHPVLANSRRIIASSLVTGFHRVYGLTDIFLFGLTSDLAVYFDPLTHKSWCDDQGIDHSCPLKQSTPVVSEIFLCARYLAGKGESLTWTKKHWHKCLANYFCIVDSESIDLFWKKYSWEFTSRFDRGYSDRNGRMAKFSDWLQLYARFDCVRETEFDEVWKKSSGFIEQERVL